MRSKRTTFRGCMAAICAIGLAATAIQAAAQAPATTSTPAPAVTAQAPAATPPASAASAPTGPGGACIKCHEDEIGSMLGSKHAVIAHDRTPWGTGKGCQACHGESTEVAFTRGDDEFELAHTLCLS